MVSAAADADRRVRALRGPPALRRDKGRRRRAREDAEYGKGGEQGRGGGRRNREARKRGGEPQLDDTQRGPYAAPHDDQDMSHEHPKRSYVFSSPEMPGMCPYSFKELMST